MSTSTAHRTSRRARRALTAGVAAAALVALPAAADAAPGPGGAATASPTVTDVGRLPLGDPGLPETRTTEVLQDGVTLTRIVRGEPDPDHVWTVEVAIPGGATSPDPDAPPTALKDEASAAETVAELTALGFPARSEEVVTPAVADFPGGTLGWRVRVGVFADQAGADAERARIIAAGYTGSAIFTGWDSEDEDDDTGPWRLQVLTIDPRQFRGELDLTVGPDVERRERTRELAAAAGATAGPAHRATRPGSTSPTASCSARRSTGGRRWSSGTTPVAPTSSGSRGRASCAPTARPSPWTASTGCRASSATAAAPTTTCRRPPRGTTSPARTPTRSSCSPRSSPPPPRPEPASRWCSTRVGS
jgi:hypothetical protein